MTAPNDKKNNKVYPTKLKRSRGFTIVESLVAITVLVLAITGVAGAIQIGISSYIFSKDQIIAFYLAQEGFEQIRNIRDENRLKSQDWLTGIARNSDDPCYFDKACRVNPADLAEGNIAVRCGDLGSCPVLTQDPQTDFFGYNSSWPETIFRREISLTKINANEVSVLVTVNWSKGLVNREFKARENLLNWQ